MSKNHPKVKSDYNYLISAIKSLPDKKVLSNLVDCAEKHRVFPRNSPFPGKQKFAKTPYMIEPAVELSPQSDTEEVVIAKCGQGGATAGATEPLILFKILEDPGPVLAITANDELAKTWSEDRLDPMFESSGAIKKFKSTIKKNTQHGGKGSTALKKSWPGGRLDIKTYGKISQIRQISYQIVILEEEEENYNTAQKGQKQGKFRDIAYARTRAYRGRRKILRISTPLMLQTSEIWPAFLAGDQRYFYVPCPECGHLQHLEWKNIKYIKNEHDIVDPESVYYECQGEGCEFHILNEHKTEILKTKEYGGTAEWRPHNPVKARPKTKSYTFNALYVPPGMDTWSDLAQQWVDAQGDPEKLQVFINLNLAQPFDDYSEAPPAETLHVLKGTYKRGTLPDEVEGSPIFAMLGCDVQAGNKRGGEWVPGKEARIEADLWGFGLNNRSWLLEKYIIKGEVSDYRSGAFAKFKKMIVDQIFPIQPIKIFIDSRFMTDEVRKFCDRSSNIFPIMGEGKAAKGQYFRKVDLQGYQTSYGSPLPMYELNTGPIKRRIYNSLAIRKDPMPGSGYPAGYRMFPIDIEHKYFMQLTSERPTAVIKNGKHHHYDWIAHGANESLDCAVYAEEAKEVFIYETSITFGAEASDYRAFWDWAFRKYGLQVVKVRVSA